MTSDNPDKDVAFGFRRVAEGDKQGLVNEVFAKAALRYDQMNDLMSVGLHRLWKDDLIAMLAPPRRATPFHVLDVAGGTGDIAFRIVRAGGAGTRVTVADISPEMVAEGRKRAAAEGFAGRCEFTVGNAEALAFPDRGFEAYTIAFGIRNVVDREQGCREFARVLGPGGRLAILEFGTPQLPGLRQLYQWYFRAVLPKIGGLISGNRDAYAYLPASVGEFPPPAEFADVLRRAGFREVEWKALTFGVVYLYIATK